MSLCHMLQVSYKHDFLKVISHMPKTLWCLGCGMLPGENKRKDAMVGRGTAKAYANKTAFNKIKRTVQVNEAGIKTFKRKAGCLN